MADIFVNINSKTILLFVLYSDSLPLGRHRIRYFTKCYFAVPAVKVVDSSLQTIVRYSVFLLA